MNHGVEIHEDVVEYAREKLEEFKAKTKAFEEFDFSEPQFVVGNCLQLNSACRLYDRVYCGAACPSEHENYMRNLIKVGGILVMPLNDQVKFFIVSKTFVSVTGPCHSYESSYILHLSH